MSAFPSSKRGLLIVIEGLDRSGKTTQCQRLLESFQAQSQSQSQSQPSSSPAQTQAPPSPAPARLQKFPDRTTPTGTMINTYLTTTTATTDDHTIHLLFAANRWEARPALLTSLATNTTVIVDRYSFSGAVYSAAKQLPDLSLQWAWDCEVGLPRPDLVVFLDVPEQVQLARGGFGEERYERLDLQRRVRTLFGAVLDKVEGEMGVRVRKVDAGQGVDEVQGEVWRLYQELLEEGVSEEVGKLGPLAFE